MKRNIRMILIVAFVVGATGCQLGRFAGRGIAGSGNRKTEKRELKSFSGIDTYGAFEVNIICQKPAGLEIEADDNILPLIKTEVRDGILYVTNTQEYHASKSPTLRMSSQ